MQPAIAESKTMADQPNTTMPSPSFAQPDGNNAGNAMTPVAENKTSNRNTEVEKPQQQIQHSQPIVAESKKEEVKVVEPEKPEVQEEENITSPPPVIPGSFSPNADGKNDTYIIQIENEMQYELVIRDKRSGKVVFESMNKEKVWDGTNMNSGEQCEAGPNYVYVFKYQQKGGKEEVKNGIIAIWR
jgi:gliding motility-associated-like protein